MCAEGDYMSVVCSWPNSIPLVVLALGEDSKFKGENLLTFNKMEVNFMSDEALACSLSRKMGN
jgi:hypothetical protein